jgi:hypothetical protein
MINVWRLLWLVGLVIGYAVLLVFALEAGGPRILLPSLEWALPLTVLLWAGPFYLWVLWRNLDRVTAVELGLGFVPFAVWYVAATNYFHSITGFGSGLAQLSLVALLGGVCLLRFVPMERLRRISELRMVLALGCIWLAGGILVAWLVPPIAD